MLVWNGPDGLFLLVEASDLSGQSEPKHSRFFFCDVRHVCHEFCAVDVTLGRNEERFAWVLKLQVGEGVFRGALFGGASRRASGPGGRLRHNFGRHVERPRCRCGWSMKAHFISVCQSRGRFQSKIHAGADGESHPFRGDDLPAVVGA